MKDITLLGIVLQTPGSLAPIIWGSPGVGKSSRIGQLAGQFGAHLETVIASVRDPSDFAGLPVPDNGHGVRLEPPAWAVKANAAPRSWVFLDEASCAPPAVQAALLRPVLERVVGDLKLHDKVQFIAAANPPDQAAGGWELAAPLANRFVHLVWTVPTVEDWSDWLTGADGGHQAVPTVQPEAWAKQFVMAKSLVSAFLRRRPALLAEDPEKVVGRFPQAYATPRSWECAVRLLASCRALGNDEAILPLMTGVLGEPVALELSTWLRANDLPDPEELLARPASWKPDEKYPDRVFATCLSVAGLVADDIRTKKHPKAKLSERWVSAWKVLNQAMPIGKDIVYIAARQLAARDVRPNEGLIDPTVKEIGKQLREVAAAAGIN